MQFDYSAWKTESPNTLIDDHFPYCEYERHIITKPCIIYIPRGFEHNPMDIKRVGKPLLFMPLHLAPYFNGYYQTGYMQFIGHEKID